MLATFNGVPVFSATIPIDPLRNPAVAEGPVLLHSGELTLSRTDLVVPGRGFDFVFTRTYRSGVQFEGPLGSSWDHNQNRRLVEVDSTNLADVQRTLPSAGVGDVVRVEAGRADLYQSNRDGTYTSPAGFYNQLTQAIDGSYSERSRDGAVSEYGAPDADGISPILRVEDRNGNALTYHYDHATGYLMEVFDTLGRRYAFEYGDDDRLDAVVDFAGRRISFDYDANGDLTSATSPAVTGTSTHNDFPDGTTEVYGYSSGFADERLNHNLLAVTAPNEAASGGPPWMTFSYDENMASPDADRVLISQVGGTNDSNVPAGGVINYSYRELPATPPPGELAKAVFETSVTDRNGNLAIYQTNQLGNIVSIVDQTNRNLRPGEGNYLTTFDYNADSEVVRSVLPEGNSVQYVYDVLNPDRFQQGNLLSMTELPDADRGGDQAFRTTTYTYEPVYNQVRSVVEPRGNDPSYVPQNGGQPSAERYATTYTFDYQEGADFAALGAELGISALEAEDLLAAAKIPMNLGDVNGDRLTNQIVGNLVRADYPTVHLLAGSNNELIEGDLTQEIFETWQYNQFGQTVQYQDPEANVTQSHYYSEQDPDGDGIINNPAGDTTTGGYLHEIARDTSSDPARNSATDPAPTNIRTRYEYDPFGNVTRLVDGRGVATDYEYNQLNELVQFTRAAAVDLLMADPDEPLLLTADPDEPLLLTAFQYKERFYYDANGNLIRRQVEDRGGTSNVGVPGDYNGNGVGDAADYTLWRNSQGQLVPAGTGADGDGDGKVGPKDYDFWKREFGESTPYVDYFYNYDILDQLIETSAEVSAGEYLATRYRYDPNGNLVLTILPEGNATAATYDERDLLLASTAGAIAPPPLALLGSADPTNYDVRGGIASTTTYHYDGNRNVIEAVDADDSDGSAGNNSTLGGAGDRTRYLYDGFDRLTSIIDAVGNQSVIQYDPAGNVVRESHFGPVGGASPTDDGVNAAPGPVSINGVIQISNLVNFDLNPLLSATENSYDELSRLFYYDLVLLVETTATVRTPDVTDGATDIGKGDLTPGDNQTIPTNIAIGVPIVGRVTTRIEYDRDSRPTFVVEDDEDVSRTFYDGAGRVIKTLDPENNMVETAYDDNNNVIEVRETDVAQVPGVADEVFLTTYFYDSLNRLQQSVDNLGRSTSYRYDSRNNLVATSDAQGPLTGAQIMRRAFPEGARTVNLINDFGNVQVFEYDGIGRQIRATTILTASGDGDGQHVGASIEGVRNDSNAPESFVPAADLSQGGGDGLIRSATLYDDNSLPIADVDDQGNVTIYLYDDLNRRVAVTNGMTTSTAAPWNKDLTLGPRQIVTPTAATLNEPAFIDASKIDSQLDAIRGEITAIEPLFPAQADQIDDDPPTSIVYGYDPDDELLIYEDENDSESLHGYDAIHRLTRGRTFRAGQSDSFVGDPIFAPDPVADPSHPSSSFPPVVGTTKQDFQYDGLSRLVRATDNNDPGDPRDDSVIDRSYDSLDRLIEERQQFGFNPEQVVSAAWRADGLLTELVYPNGRSVEYGYDGLDRVGTVDDIGSVIAAYDYIGSGGQVLRHVNGNGTQITLLDPTETIDVGRDGVGRVTELRHEKIERDGSTELLLGFGYEYDRVGARVTREQKLHDPTNDETRDYDSVGRLVEFHRPNPGAIAPSRENWELDGNDNWTQVDDEQREYSSNDEIVTRTDGGVTTLLYDDNGNLIDDGTFSYQYDADNRLRKVVDIASNTIVGVYSYDAFGRRIEKTTDVVGFHEQYLYFGDKVIEERDGTGQVLRQYAYGQGGERLVMDVNADGGPSAIDKNDDRSFYHSNVLGHVYGLTDENGNLVEAYQYDAYGDQTTVFSGGDNRVIDFGGDDEIAVDAGSPLSNPYLYKGMRFDAETGLYLRGSRYFDSGLGRYITRDGGGEYNQNAAANGAARVKVKFPWLHDSATDGTASMWLRVAQLPMGGSMLLMDDTASCWIRMQQMPTSGSMGPVRMPYPVLAGSVDGSSVAVIRQEGLNNKYPENMQHESRNAAAVDVRGWNPKDKIAFVGEASSTVAPIDSVGRYRVVMPFDLVRYTMFTPNGTPLRAETRVSREFFDALITEVTFPALDATHVPGRPSYSDVKTQILVGQSRAMPVFPSLWFTMSTVAVPMFPGDPFPKPQPEPPQEPGTNKVPILLSPAPQPIPIPYPSLP